jgi:hypothetical protein
MEKVLGWPGLSDVGVEGVQTLQRPKPHRFASILREKGHPHGPADLYRTVLDGKTRSDHAVRTDADSMRACIADALT